jgi:hypothetical protein
MTFPEAVEIARRTLTEYEPRLGGKLKGCRPYTNSAKPLKKEPPYKGSLSIAPEGDIESAVCAVLDQLLNLDGGFWMSEPQPMQPGNAEVATVAHNDLRLRLSYRYEVAPDYRTYCLWVEGWYYPA